MCIHSECAFSHRQGSSTLHRFTHHPALVETQHVIADLKQFIETPNGQEENTCTSGYVLSRAVLPQRYKLEHSELRALPPCQNLDAQPVDDRAVPVW